MSGAASAARAKLIVLTGVRREIELDPTRAFAIGRSSAADLRLETDLVSRRHAALEPGPEGWRIVDLDSTNGTSVDDEPLAPGGSRILHSGCEISLGDGAVRLLFEAVRPAQPQAPAEPNAAHEPPRPAPELTEAGVPLRPTLNPGAPKRAPEIEPGMVVRAPQAGIRLSDVLPFLSKDRTVLQRSFLVPGIVSVLVMLELFRLNAAATQAVAHGSLATYVAETTKFIQVLGGYLIAAFAFAIVAVTGRRLPWWIYAGALVLETILMLALIGPIEAPFRAIAGVFGNEQTPFGPASIAFFIIGVGFPEELLKAIPLVLFTFVLARGKVRDPLDGVGVAVVAAAAFVFIETEFQYVPQEIDSYVKALGNSGIGLGFASGLELLIARVLGSIAGHLAWSGYLGYAIVLARRRRSWLMVPGAWALVAALHGCWDAASGLDGGPEQLTLLFSIAVISFVLLFTAVRRSRGIAGLSQPLRSTEPA